MCVARVAFENADVDPLLIFGILPLPSPPRVSNRMGRVLLNHVRILLIVRKRQPKWAVGKYPATVLQTVGRAGVRTIKHVYFHLWRVVRQMSLIKSMLRRSSVQVSRQLRSSPRCDGLERPRPTVSHSPDAAKNLDPSSSFLYLSYRQGRCILVLSAKIHSVNSVTVQNWSASPQLRHTGSNF